VIHVEGGVVTVDFVRVSMRVREAKPSKGKLPKSNGYSDPAPDPGPGAVTGVGSQWLIVHDDVSVGSTQSPISTPIMWYGSA
jgi:hypothetical protein